MSGGSRMDGGPRTVIVIGAGIVGLSTAWFLQDHGVDVTVVDRDGVAAGASWGNAGWISPALTAPLNSPGVLREGLRALANPAAPLHIPLRADTELARFLLRFALNCRPRVWEAATRANAVLNDEAIETFDVLVAGGVDAPVTDTSVAVAFRSDAQAKRFLGELALMADGDHPLRVDSLSGPELRELVPLASAAVTTVVNVHGQRFVDPGRFTRSLGQEVLNRGAELQTADIVRLSDSDHGVIAHTRAGGQIRADAAVLAAGAWLPQLTDGRVRVRLQAGRGYSFTVPVERALPGPIYLPEARIACTPYRGALRVAGTMEFRRPSEPLMQRRVDAIVAAAAPLLAGVRWDERTDVWVGRGRSPTTAGPSSANWPPTHSWQADTGCGAWHMDPPPAGCWQNRSSPASNPRRFAPSTHDADRTPRNSADPDQQPPFTGATGSSGAVRTQPAPDDEHVSEGSQAMSTSNRIWMTTHARQRLEEELAALLSPSTAVVGDNGDRSDQIIDAWLARKTRIRQIHDMLSKAAVGTNPPDDGLAEPGMVLTVRYDDTGEVETFLLGARGAEDTDIEVYSVDSPLGDALAGASPGDRRSYALPSGAVQPVTLLSATPFGTHVVDAGAEPAARV